MRPISARKRDRKAIRNRKGLIRETTGSGAGGTTGCAFDRLVFLNALDKPCFLRLYIAINMLLVTYAPDNILEKGHNK
jgi:hypothetical protein